MGIEVDPMYGGSGADFFCTVLAVEELAKVDMGVTLVTDIQNTITNPLFIQLGTEEQKQKYLTRLCTDTVWKYFVKIYIQLKFT